jgi:hypothetical protein
MLDIEKIALLQRIANSIKEDIQNNLTIKALGKLEILEGELDILRNIIEKEKEENKDEEDAPQIINSNSDNDIIDVTD